MWKFIKHEWAYWLRSPMTWIFFLINTLLVMGAVSSDNINIGGGVGSVHKNAPYVIQNYYGVMSLVCLLMTTAFMNASANRDFQSGMYQFIFTSPIKKSHYYFGKFLGAFSMAVLPLLGVSVGALIGPLMPWAEPERYGEVYLSGHLDGLISFGIPNTFIAGVLLFGLAILFRSNIVSFVGAMLILVFYIVSAGFTRDIDKEWLANLLDPFGFRPEGIVAKYMTVDEKNISGVPLSGAFLYNRLIWVGLSLAGLFALYFRFSFNTRNEKKKSESKKSKIGSPIRNIQFLNPVPEYKTNLGTLVSLTWFETKAIIKNPTFIIIVLLGLINLVTSLTSFTGRYGVEQYPVTYDVIDSIRGSFYLYIIAIITFYTGVLVWKERDAGFSEIKDATPVQSGMLFVSKLVAMIFALGLILSLTILIGMIAQTFYGYTNYKIDVYLSSLLIFDLLSFSFMVVIALFFHYIINQRYIAYFAFVAFLIFNTFIWGVLEVNSNMLKYGNAPNATYSDMNGFGPFIESIAAFNIYWILFATILSIVTYAFMVQGKETLFKQRLKKAGVSLRKNGLLIGIPILCFLLFGSFVFYNTQILNTYKSTKEQENIQKNYEIKYKKYENMAQPRIYKLNYTIDIFPYERNLNVKTEVWIKNNHPTAIKEIHFTLPPVPDSVHINISKAKLKLSDEDCGYRIYTLNTPLESGDSMMFVVEANHLSKGFENEVSFTQLTQNGTFFNNTDILPSIGYNNRYEISDKNRRVKLNLPKKKRKPLLDESDLQARSNTYISSDADWVMVNTVISTAPDQIAVAPGSLLSSWEKNGRKYFSYKLDQQSLNFYSFISAKYEVKRKKWNGIDLEVYYSKEHEYNVPNMMKSMEKSLSYYTKNFGPYYHKQCRIIEFPRYASFAQAFPGTMPYSEGIGFIVDLRNVTKDDIDLVFYVVAHEMGHQYWAHQLCGADMQGSEMMSEGFAQYSALMVMEKEYGRDKMKKFLEYEMDDYLRGRSTEFEAERPLMKTEGQGYIHYQKASVVMYYLKEMIGEDKVNFALKSLIDSFAYQAPPYPTSYAAVRAFTAVTPDTLQYLIKDLFENITLFSNRVLTVTSKKSGNDYLVTITTKSEKFYADSLGKETSVPVSDYMDLMVFAKPENDKNLGSVLASKRVKVTKQDNTFTFITTSPPYQAGIDPYNFLVDRIPDDNLKKVEEE